MGGGDPAGQGGPRAHRCRAQLCASGFAAGGIVAMPLTGLLVHRFRSGLASIVAGFAFAAAVAAIGFTRSLETLSVIACLTGVTSGVTDVAMNAKASDVERRSGRPIMSSFHAAFSLGGAGGRLVGRLAWGEGNGFGSPGPRSAVVAACRVAVPLLMREGHGFQAQDLRRRTGASYRSRRSLSY